MSREPSDTRTRILDVTWRLMEQRPGQGISMGDIAKAAGISRQAVYLHFASRTELMVAVTHYVDEVKGLDKRLEKLNDVESGLEFLEVCVDIWGNYIPEIHALARSMMRTRDTDEAMAAAWKGCMGCLKDVCAQAVAMLEREGRLTSAWSPEEATDLLWTLLSIENWEQLTIDCGWSTPRYVEKMKALLRRLLVVKASRAIRTEFVVTR